MKPKFKVGDILKWNDWFYREVRATIARIEYPDYVYKFIQHYNPHLIGKTTSAHYLIIEECCTATTLINYNDIWAKLNA